MDLEKGDDQAWHWVGRADFRCAAGRGGGTAAIAPPGPGSYDFPLAEPKDLKTAGLAPQAGAEIAL